MPKKLSKKARKKLEEQRKREAEEAEKREAERLEQERIEKEIAAKKEAERLAFEAEEKERLKHLVKEMAPFEINLARALERQQAEYEVEKEWERYNLKGDQAIPYNKTQISALYSRYKDSKIVEHLEYNELFDMMQEVESVCHELRVFSLKAKVDNDKKNELWYNLYIDMFRDITLQKVKLITADLANNSYIYIQEVEKELELLKKNNTTHITQTNKKSKTVCYDYEDVKYGMLINAEEKSQNTTNFEFPEIQAKSGVPRYLPNGNFLLRLFWTSYDYLTPKSKHSKKMIIGGLFDVTVFNSLQQPKPFKSYFIKPFRPEVESLEILPFPKPNSDNKVIVSSSSNKLKVGYKLPDNLYIDTKEEPRIIQWVPELQEWTEDYIDDVEIKLGKILEMTTKRFVPIAFCLDRTIDFPYMSWKLRSINDKMALLDLKGKRLSLQFEIGLGYVLLRPTEYPEFAHILGIKHQPALILYELLRCGINLLPEDHDHEDILPNLKDNAAEDKAIEDICIAIRSYYFKSTRWNAGGPKECVMVRFLENLAYDEYINEDFEMDWKTACWWSNKCTLVKARDHHGTANYERELNILTHSNFYLLLKHHELASDIEVLNRFKEYKEYKEDYYHNVMFFSTLKKFLKHLRLLSFTSNKPN